MFTEKMGSNGRRVDVGASAGGPQPPVSQGSMYTLTLDEVQQQLGDLGKPLASMNLDELLKSVWTAESNQGVTSGQAEYSQHANAQPASAMPHQWSLNISQDVRKRTVDEVWQDIQQSQKKNNGTSSNNNNISGGSSNLDKKDSRQNTPGEMTLEDFLVKAGIVAPSSPKKKNPAPVIDSSASHQQINQQAQWMHYQVPQIQSQHVYMTGHPSVQQSLPIGANPMMEMAYPETQIATSPSHLMHNLSDTQTPGRKRVASGDVMEKTVERRQKRMIKNRESAARSRARKQAYTHELENKISRLEEENERLKKQKEMGKVVVSAPPPEPKYQLRRTSSSPF